MKAFIFFVILSASSVGLAHGEEKPGPHKGYIRMPGAYHVEVVPTRAGFDIYLLDMNFKNPTVKKSSVLAKILVDGKETKASCTPRVKSYRCEFINGVSLERGKLVIEATRDGQKGGLAVYDLPLSHSAPAGAHDKH